MSDEDQNHQHTEIDIDFTDADLTKVSHVFFEESKELLNDLDDYILKLEENPDDSQLINTLFRRVHTLKGSVGAVSGGQLFGQVAHEFENMLSRLKTEHRPATKEVIDIFLKSSRLLKIIADCLRNNIEIYPEAVSESIDLIAEFNNFSFDIGTILVGKKRKKFTVENNKEDFSEDGVWLSQKQLHELMRISGELLVLKNYHQMLHQTIDIREQYEVYERRQTEFAQNLTKISDLLQTQIMLVRKATAQDCFNGLNAVIRQGSAELNKDVQLNAEGMDEYIDKALGKDLFECLVHMARNSMDHGIEDNFDRVSFGKPAIGTLYLKVAEKNGVIHLNFGDDGRGLNKDGIIKKAIRSGLVRDEDVKEMNDEQIYELIFKPGFSTRDEVTTMSGRGVGMDVVKGTVEKYGGRISVSTELGKGTSFKLEVPVPQNIMVEATLLAKWDHFMMAVPLSTVGYITSCKDLQLTKVDELRFCQFAGSTVPLMTYRELLNGRMEEEDRKIATMSAVFIKTKEASMGLLVDKIERQSDLVVKPFDRMVHHVAGFKGVSVLADESISFIVDPADVFTMIHKIERSHPQISTKMEKAS